MNIFGAIMNKIMHPFGGGAPAPADAAAPAPADAAPAPAAPPPPPAEPVDVEAVLTKMADDKGGGGNWRTSIVDLLKLLDMDSSLTARSQLADELNVHAGENGSAEENIALSKAVWAKLAENGGKVPDSLKG